MTLYRVSGFVFASALRFPELTPVAGRAPECVLSVSRRARPDSPLRWYHRWRLPGGRDWLRFAHQRSGGYLLRFTKLADFDVAADASRVVCCPRGRTPVSTIRHVFLHQVLPLVMAQRGRIAVHASAVVTPRGAVAFLGGPGRGKSTLAASFWASGFPLITDDCLLVDDRAGAIVAVPSYPALRLWPDAFERLAGDAPARPAVHYSDKLRLVATGRRGRFARGGVRLARAYVLAPLRRREAPVAIEPLSARDALVELVAHLYRLDVGGRDTLRRDFDRLASIARQLPLRRLHVPRGLARLAEVRHAIQRDLEM